MRRTGRSVCGWRPRLAVRLAPSRRLAWCSIRTARRVNEAFSSCLCLAGLQYVDGLGELPGAPGAAAELPENLPCLELRVRAFAGCAETGVGAVGFLLGFRLVPAPV